MSNKRLQRDSVERPGPPPSGIPKQRLPRWLSTCLRLICYPFMWMDLIAQKVTQWSTPPPYKITGGCKQRGHCCHYVLMGWPPIMDKWPWFGKFWVWWYTEVHSFYMRGYDLEDESNEVAKVMGGPSELFG